MHNYEIIFLFSFCACVVRVICAGIKFLLTWENSPMQLADVIRTFLGNSQVCFIIYLNRVCLHICFSMHYCKCYYLHNKLYYPFFPFTTWLCGDAIVNIEPFCTCSFSLHVAVTVILIATLELPMAEWDRWANL